ncbi:MAG: ComEA family DNA-binding protein [Armatimonadota bacterium]|nr:ComEA family DNA-binding protein [Armatimonadota bacterium]
MSWLELNQNQKLALYILLGLSAIGLAVSCMRHGGFGSGEIELREPADTTVSGADRSDAGSAAKVVFQVAGCINRPGVYSLKQGSRVIDAIKAAGGAKANADTEAINLAAKIVDGSRIYVPSKSEAPNGGTEVSPFASPATLRTGSASSSSQSDAGGTVVNINTAGPDELDRLPGVGPVTAQRIIEYRTQIGRFTSINQLLDVKGIGPKKLEQMRSYVAL